MKTAEELNAFKEEVETLNKKLQELTEEEWSSLDGDLLPKNEGWPHISLWRLHYRCAGAGCFAARADQPDWKTKGMAQRKYLKEVPLTVSETMLEYYLANKPTDSDWYVLHLTSIEAFLGSSSLSRLYMRKLCGTVLEKKDGVPSACVVKYQKMDWGM